MPVTYDPRTVKPGEGFVGNPVTHYPYFLFCTMGGERPCGTIWTARNEADYLLKAAKRREHEATCQGGLIVATSMSEVRRG